jgi:hypothetical protein
VRINTSLGQYTVTRSPHSQLEMLNVLVGFEQSNKYSISACKFVSVALKARAHSYLPDNEQGEALGFIVEEPRGLLSTLSRQLFRTHRPFRALVLDQSGAPILWVGLLTPPQHHPRAIENNWSRFDVRLRGSTPECTFNTRILMSTWTS